MKYLQLYLRRSKCLIKLSVIIIPSLSSVTHLALWYSETDTVKIYLMVKLENVIS